MRDFALLLHYLHEVEFYAKLFRRAEADGNFAERLKSLLRGDVPSRTSVASCEWLIIQRYLFKENSRDPRLFLPRINPESLHWMRGERDLALYNPPDGAFSFRMWHNLDWVSTLCGWIHKELVSFDMEDNAMTAVSYGENKKEEFTYHQREALWTKFFLEYAGGETSAEQMLIQNFHRGSVAFGA